MPDSAVIEETKEQVNVQTADYPQAVDKPTQEAGNNLDLLLDVPMAVTVSLGGTEIPVHRLLQLAPGSVIELERLIDEPADLYVRDIKFATGDIVVVDGHFAIKIKQILGCDMGGNS
jgi:flagellar motor switch protein FliN/FliY